MEVAKTYTNWEREGEPFREGDKNYVYVIHPKTGKSKKVRYYGEVELYDRRKLFGFDKGYITIFKGVNAENEEYFRMSCARLASFFGWYLVSSEEFNEPLPEGVEPVKLYWEDVTVDNKWMDSNDIRRIVKQKINNIFFT